MDKTTENSSMFQIETINIGSDRKDKYGIQLMDRINSLNSNIGPSKQCAMPHHGSGTTLLFVH